MKILVIDNYDSFTYNLVYMLKLNKKVSRLDVLRNNKIEMKEVAGYDKIVISPGPGIPSEAGSFVDILRLYSSSKSILGVCLGHQGMGEVFNCELENMNEVLHGVADEVSVDQKDYLFAGLEEKITCGRYHSWRIKKMSVKDPIEVIATDSEGEVMAIRHRDFDLRGLQFHPESIMTTKGYVIIDNWINN